LIQAVLMFAAIGGLIPWGIAATIVLMEHAF
jgi:hypothetical protein